mmetsp:Transcript_30461/g.43195  ORF Transcript_30461/g.43195 Transcript_30461/m.43195 type:complete len:191 (-) Transcript_30461:330-902(-)|eukprot:CAMPEP_0202441792 /NCGR_PEP_ID=MMETSP1360-20130828/1300_1 /ASSEMBLY_ACC=CAM_ASM_000848 /TAXON_ID=515479 /ORGANISM="Licmophora paradoxa, Strain CCMP2313" /LENGTH=190 /DNA_ID=CAMNT_0049056935 /DNA_START=177 /DNA_END=749 /DNA_ORIENTATION=-
MSSGKESGSALARKRRKARRLQGNKRNREDLEDVISSSSNKKPHITGIKVNARYDPGVKMTREQLREWRKEARRVRNRESAAASRRRTKELVDKLEAKVQLLESKYGAALNRIVELEAAASTVNDTTASPARPQNTQDNLCVISPCHSEASSPLATPVISPNSPRHVFSLSESQDMGANFSHLTDMISTA